MIKIPLQIITFSFFFAVHRTAKNLYINLHKKLTIVLNGERERERERAICGGFTTLKVYFHRKILMLRCSLFIFKKLN